MARVLPCLCHAYPVRECAASNALQPFAEPPVCTLAAKSSNTIHQYTGRILSIHLMLLLFHLLGYIGLYVNIIII